MRIVQVYFACITERGGFICPQHIRQKFGYFHCTSGLVSGSNSILNQKELDVKKCDTDATCRLICGEHYLSVQYGSLNIGCASVRYGDFLLFRCSSLSQFIA